MLPPKVFKGVEELQTASDPAYCCTAINAVTCDTYINSLAPDLEHVLCHTKHLWEDLRGARIFITGGTGFLGCWLLETFAWANERLKLGASAVVLTRSPDAFQDKAPHLAGNPTLRLYCGDVRTFAFPDEEFTHVIHAATPASTAVNEQDPLATLDTIVQGTRHTLDFTLRSRARKFLFTSSGAVYGKPQSSTPGIPETLDCAPDVMNTRSAYGQGKRIAELLCAIYHSQTGVEATVARCFTFIGPYMPLDSSFAAGNFLRDRLENMPIRVLGNGTPIRSYLYAADAAIWLWTILMKGVACRPYNVGSELPMRLAEVAAKVSKARTPEVPVKIARRADTTESPDCYVPSTRRAQSDLGLYQWISLEDALSRSLRWFDVKKAARDKGAR